MKINNLLGLISSWVLVIDADAAVGWTFVNGESPELAVDHQYTASSTATPTITQFFAAPIEDQPAWAQSTGPNDPGPYHDIIADFSSNVNGQLNLTSSPGTKSGRITFRLDQATSGPITFRFAYNHELTSIPSNEVVGSFTSASAFIIRQNQNVGFDYGIDVELINTSLDLVDMFGNVTPTATNWENSANGNDWDPIGTGVTIDGLNGPNILETTVSSSSAAVSGFQIVDDTRGDSSLLQKGWEFTIDPGVNTFASGTQWNFTFDGMRRLDARSIPEPTSLVFTLLSLPLMALRKRKS